MPASGTIWALLYRGRAPTGTLAYPVGAPQYATGVISSGPGGWRTSRASRSGNFILAGVLGGFVGIIESFRINSIDPLAGGPDIVLLCIAAAVIGGTVLERDRDHHRRGPRGSSRHLEDGFTLTGGYAPTYNGILGVAILIAMILNVYIAGFRGGGGG